MLELKHIDTLLLQEMEEVKGGTAGTCECYSGAGQSPEEGGKCTCIHAAGQMYKPETTPPPECTCTGGGAGQ